MGLSPYIQKRWLFPPPYGAMPECGKMPALTALLRRAYLNDGNAEPARVAHDAENWFGRKHMLAQSVRAGQYYLFALSSSQ